MPANLNFLNAVRGLIVDHASAHGINLREQFGTREKFIGFVTACAIKAAQDIAGLSLRDAYDLVMGEGAYQQLADEVWAAAQA